MSYLFLVALGPVQDFIAAARRTADLKAGSDILVEVAKAVAAKIGEPPHSGTLIFPSKVEEDPPNKILAQLPESADPAALAAELKCVARKVLTDNWGSIWRKLSEEQKALIDDIRAVAQLERFLEFFAAWEPLTTQESYKTTRAKVETTLAGRKALREFEAVSEILAGPGIPKSPLDPAWSSVLHENNPAETALSNGPLYLKASELLDGMSLLKRVRGHRETRREKGGVPSTAEMAIRCLESKWQDPDRITAARQRLEEFLVRKDIDLDFGDLFFETRLAEEEERCTKQKLPELPLDQIHADTFTLLHEAGYGSPPPYYALLVADGDRMGELLSHPDKNSLQDHKAFSEALYRFGEQAKPIITKHRGFAVYVGGDDVLALLPVDRAIACAWELHEQFNRSLAEVKGGQVKPAVGTLSAGIAIVHYREPLQISLDRARAAEKAAKDAGRDALAVALHTRGGAPALHAARWNVSELQESWTFWTDAFENNGLSRGLPYEFRELAQQAQKVTLPEGVLQAEAKRILQRKEGGKGLLERQPNVLDTINTAESLAQLAEQLIIARFLAKPEGER